MKIYSIRSALSTVGNFDLIHEVYLAYTSSDTKFDRGSRVVYVVYKKD